MASDKMLRRDPSQMPELYEGYTENAARASSDSVSHRVRQVFQWIYEPMDAERRRKRAPVDATSRKRGRTTARAGPEPKRRRVDDLAEAMGHLGLHARPRPLPAMASNKMPRRDASQMPDLFAGFSDADAQESSDHVSHGVRQVFQRIFQRVDTEGRRKRAAVDATSRKRGRTTARAGPEPKRRRVDDLAEAMGLHARPRPGSGRLTALRQNEARRRHVRTRFATVFKWVSGHHTRTPLATVRERALGLRTSPMKPRALIAMCRNASLSLSAQRAAAQPLEEQDTVELDRAMDAVALRRALGERFV